MCVQIQGCVPRTNRTDCGFGLQGHGLFLGMPSSVAEIDSRFFRFGAFTFHPLSGELVKKEPESGCNRSLPSC
jgi:hypothetical protein